MAYLCDEISDWKVHFGRACNVLQANSGKISKVDEIVSRPLDSRSVT